MAAALDPSIRELGNDNDDDADVGGGVGDEKTVGGAATAEPTSDVSESGKLDTPPALPFSKARCIALVATVTGASFLNTLSSQAVVIILPTIGRDLSIPESRLQWVVSAYALTFGTFLLLWGRIADIYGKRDIFIWGSAFVAVTLIANPFLPNEIAFDLFRGLQGLGAAANVPTAIGILGVTFPPGKAKNYAFSAYASGAPLGSVFGNILAGFIASATSWKWVFGALGGLGVVVTAAGVFFLPPPPVSTVPSKKGLVLLKSVDWLGGFLVTAGLLALLFALTEGNVVGWSTPWVPVLIVVAVILLGVFYAWQWYQENRTTRRPLIKVSIFRNGRFCAGLAIMALFFASFNNFIVYATYFFQDYQGLSPLQTTLRFIPTGATGVLVAFIVSHLISRVPTWILLLCANGAMSISCLLFAVPLPRSTSYFAFGLPAFILSVIGADITWPCLTLFTSKSLPQEDQALGGGLINASAGVGRAIGLAIDTAIQTAVLARERGVSVEHAGKITRWDGPSIVSIRAANWFNFALGLLCVAVVSIAFRGTGIVGGREKPKEKPAGILNNGDQSLTARKE
ncbi:putative major facilitator superfamily transporter [Rosellinia necatrix]|uniref:Putative major facilitator superfamily transporter n=1 Tax=Rosellinia necatrix TaxID=77044 RepID=A0A1W2TTQ3_ROSNE|nr:putative major facilitator superfamily transporter [Rosellinia necatrix]